LRPITKSEAQANAEALVRREAPASSEHQASVRRAWDHRARQPKDLQQAVFYARKAYQDEVPQQLHDGPDEIGEGGVPRFSADAASYLFGDPTTASDARRDPVDKRLEAVSWFRHPFQATLSAMLSAGHPPTERLAKIVSHITIGQMGPVEAAVKEKAHPDDAQLVAETALRRFLADLSDLRLQAGRVKDPEVQMTA
jgi:hypothetical protein